MAEQHEQFIKDILPVATHVIKTILVDTIDHIADEVKKEALMTKLDKILPNMPIGARKLTVGHKTYFMVFKPCDDVKYYSLDTQLNKIKRQLPADQHDRFKIEVSVTLSSIPNIYRRLMESHADFCDQLVEALPEDRKTNVTSNLMEPKNYTAAMYEDGIRFALYIEKEST